MRKIIENVRFMQDGTMVFGDLHLEDGFVERIDYKTPRGRGNIAVLGFVDIHTHGFGGMSAEECDIHKLQELARRYAKRGITTFCPTLSARALHEYIPYIEAYRKAFQGDTHGAHYGGVHLEGPYISPLYHGNMDIQQAQSIQISELDAFLSAYHEDIRIMTIAPELEHAMEAIHLLHLYGIEVSLGHSNATFAQTQQALQEGATQVTHLCNAMPEIDHKHPGMMDAILLSDCRCEIIMDQTHIQPEMMKWLLRLLGSQRVIATGDGCCRAGIDAAEGHVFEDGSYIKQQAVYNKENERLGSCIDLLDIFRWLYPLHGLQDSMRMTSLNAASLLKALPQEIALGRKVDLVILDADLQLQDVLINGRSVI